MYSGITLPITRPPCRAQCVARLQWLGVSLGSFLTLELRNCDAGLSFAPRQRDRRHRKHMDWPLLEQAVLLKIGGRCLRNLGVARRALSDCLNARDARSRSAMPLLYAHGITHVGATMTWSVSRCPIVNCENCVIGWLSFWKYRLVLGTRAMRCGAVPGHLTGEQSLECLAGAHGLYKQHPGQNQLEGPCKEIKAKPFVQVLGRPSSPSPGVRAPRPTTGTKHIKSKRKTSKQNKN